MLSRARTHKAAVRTISMPQHQGPDTVTRRAACLGAGAVGHLKAELLCHEGWLHHRFHALVCVQEH